MIGEQQPHPVNGYAGHSMNSGDRKTDNSLRSRYSDELLEPSRKPRETGSLVEFVSDTPGPRLDLARTMS